MEKYNTTVISTNNDHNFPEILFDKIRATVAALSILANPITPSSLTTATGAAKLITTTTLTGLFLSSCGDNPTNIIPEAPEDKEAPKITRYLPTLEIPKGTTAITTKGNNLTQSIDLYIGDTKVATGKDNMSKTGERIIKDDKTGNQIQGFISESSDLNITLKDESGNISTPPIKIKVKMLEGGNEPLISGIDYLKDRPFKLNEKYNLLDGITFSSDVETIDVFIDFNGEVTKVDDASNYIFEHPGPITIIIIAKAKDGKSQEERISKDIKPLEYEAPTYETAHPFENFSRTQYLEKQTERDFWERIMTGSEIAAELPQNKIINIIMQGETADGVDENIGNSSQTTQHSRWVYNCFKQVTQSPNVIIKGHNGNGDWKHLLNYLNSYSDPNELYLISCSLERCVGETIDELYGYSDIYAYKDIIKKSNVIPIEAGSNKYTYDGKIFDKIFNENISNGYYYNTTSINSDEYKIFTTGYYPGNNYYSSSSSKGNESKMSVGYGLEIKNIVMGCHGGVTLNNQDYFSTQSTPTAPYIAGQVANAISIIEMFQPLTTREAAIDILFTEYLKKAPIIYVDEDNNSIDTGEHIYFIDFEKLINTLVLHLEEFKLLKLNSTNLIKIEIPNDLIRIYGKGIGYIGDDGLFYSLTNDNKEMFDKDNVWFSPIAWEQYGGKLEGQNVTLTVSLLNRNGKEMSNTINNIPVEVK